MEEGYILRMHTGEGAGQEHRLSAAGVTIGRYPLADIVIDDPEVSYRHAMITFSGDVYRIADLASDAGTYVNGRRVGAEPVDLSPGDIILLGARVTLAFLQKMDTPPETVEAPFAAEHLAEQALTGANVASEPGRFDGDQLQMARESSLQPLASDPSPAPIHPEPMPPLPPRQKTNNRRIIVITAGCLLLLGCCCSATLFMYFIGGDWLFNQMGLLP